MCRDLQPIRGGQEKRASGFLLVSSAATGSLLHRLEACGLRLQTAHLFSPQTNSSILSVINSSIFTGDALTHEPCSCAGHAAAKDDVPDVTGLPCVLGADLGRKENASKSPYVDTSPHRSPLHPQHPEGVLLRDEPRRLRFVNRVLGVLDGRQLRHLVPLHYAAVRDAEAQRNCS